MRMQRESLAMVISFRYLTRARRLDLSSFSSTVYDPNGYDDVPEYKWDNNFSAKMFAEAIDEHNNTLFENLKHSVCQNLGIGYQRTGCKFFQAKVTLHYAVQSKRIAFLYVPREYSNTRRRLIFTGRDYLTRRIRRQVYGPDMDSVLEKQITMPVLIPYDLEQSLVQIVSDALDEVRLSDSQLEQILIPVHEQGKGTAIIPDLQDTAGPNGNVRFWVVGNELMWAGIDRRIDEVFEVLWALFYWRSSDIAQDHARLDQIDALVHLATSFRQRFPLRPKNTSAVPSEQPQEGHKEEAPAYLRSAKWKGLTPREAVLFKRWAFHLPINVERHFNDDKLDSDFEDDDNILYPFPDDFFWKDGDEGDGGSDGVPQWHDVDVTKDEHQDAQEEGEEGRKRKRENSGSPQDLVVHETQLGIMHRP